MTDSLNEIFAECEMPLNPLDPKTGVSENELNDMHVTLTYDKEQNRLTASGVIMEIEDLYQPAFKDLQKNILSLNDANFLPDSFRIGINLPELSVEILSSLDLKCSHDDLRGALELLIRRLTFYGIESRKRIFAAYEEYCNGA